LYAAPSISISSIADKQDYWRLPSSATLLDVIRAVRADEATHRFVNHSLANLDQQKDFNPFAIGEPGAEVRGQSWGFTRDQSKEFARKSQEVLMVESAKAAEGRGH
jgi:ubiquinol oxidase